MGAVLAAESARRETLLATLGATALALALYWLAHSYAATLGDRLQDHVPLTAGAIVRSLAKDRAIVRGAAVPILALLLASAVGASLSSAVLAATWTSAGTVVLLEVIAAWRARLRGRELIVQVGTGAAMGLAVIGVRAVLH